MPGLVLCSEVSRRKVVRDRGVVFGVILHFWLYLATDVLFLAHSLTDDCWTNSWNSLQCDWTFLPTTDQTRGGVCWNSSYVTGSLSKKGGGTVRPVIYGQ